MTRRRALHFALLGALLFGAVRVWPSPSPATRDPIVVRSAGEIDDALLLREALARGFDHSDRIARARLVALGRTLGLAPSDDEVALEQQARAFGLHRTDPLLRRHLIEMMRLSATRPEAAEMPAEDELRAYFAAHAASYAQPERRALTHIYLSRAQRGAALDGDAAALHAMLRAGRPADEVAARADPFARGAHIALATRAQLAGILGPRGADGVFALPVGQWSEPIPSSYGLHLVLVETRAEGGPPPFDSVRGQVLHAWLDERAEARLHASLAALRRRYDVRVALATPQ
ncbi:MAG: peptidyl-prolyl cis-trans isomerase [Candidatus Binatia bacterium]